MLTTLREELSALRSIGMPFEQAWEEARDLALADRPHWTGDDSYEVWLAVLEGTDSWGADSGVPIREAWRLAYEHLPSRVGSLTTRADDDYYHLPHREVA